MTKQDCSKCYNFGIVSTKLNALLVSIPFFLTFIGWGSYELYGINAKIQNVASLEKRVDKLERKGDVDEVYCATRGMETGIEY